MAERIDDKTLIELTNSFLSEAVGLRRELHQWPELAFEEIKTAARIRAELEKYGVELLPSCLATEVTARVKGKFDGPTILVREDIDALPMDEDTSLPFSSMNPGVCHSCGHDIHTASALLLARVMQNCRDSLHGTVLFTFQPAEETVAGAKAMFAAGFGKGDTRFDQVIGFHTSPEIKAGEVGVTPGPANASTDIVHITVRGEGGHGAHPQRCADTVAAAAYLVTQLQTVVSRENPPLEPAVLTIGSIHGGTAENIIPTEVRMGGTMRAFSEKTRRDMWRAIERITENCCAALRAEGSVEILEGVPVLYNDPALCSALRASCDAVLGAGHFHERPASPGSDDFSRFLAQAPGFQFRVGTGNELAESSLGIHNPKNIFDERSIYIGAVVMARYLLDQLGG